jgi:hypothetical protein
MNRGLRREVIRDDASDLTKPFCTSMEDLLWIGAYYVARILAEEAKRGSQILTPTSNKHQTIYSPYQTDGTEWRPHGIQATNLAGSSHNHFVTDDGSPGTQTRIDARE